MINLCARTILMIVISLAVGEGEFTSTLVREKTVNMKIIRRYAQVLLSCIF